MSRISHGLTGFYHKVIKLHCCKLLPISLIFQIRKWNVPTLVPHHSILMFIMKHFRLQCHFATPFFLTHADDTDYSILVRIIKSS